jgi:hypothetical protein
MNNVKHAPRHQGIVVGVEIIAHTITAPSPLAKKGKGYETHIASQVFNVKISSRR